MNYARRKRIKNMILTTQTIRGLIDHMNSEIEDIAEDERASIDSMPESLQDTDKSAKMEEAIESLESAYEPIETISSSLNELEEALEVAMV